MGKKTLSLTVIFSVWTGAAVLAGEGDPSQYDYTMPARERLFAGTLSGLVEAYQILDDGLDDPRLTGDRRELLFLHALSAAGMVVFDRSDVRVATSIVEILEPFGITVTGSTFLPEDRYDPDRMRVIFPIDPNDPDDCYELPPEADPNKAAAAFNEVIIPEIDTIITQLDTITDVPAAFAVILTPTETRLASAVEVDRGDVLALKATLLTIKAILHGAANPAYDMAVDFSDPLFDGLGCDDLPVGTTFHAVLDTYPMLLKILPETGRGRLGQAKVNLIEALNGAVGAIDYIVAETDDQIDDLLQIDDNSPSYVTVRDNLITLRDSLVNGAPATYTIGSSETYMLDRAGEPFGELILTYEIPGLTGQGSLFLSDPNVLPVTAWEIDSFEIDGQYIDADLEVWGPNWHWVWLEGMISSDGSQITNLSITHRAWPDDYTIITGLTAQRIDTEVSTVEFDLNPVFAGNVSPRDMLPEFDANDTPIVGTIGHELDNDPTLGGFTPSMTQEDWIGTKYAVYGVLDSNSLSYNEHFWHHIDQQSDVVTKLGDSEGFTATFAGDYPLYIVATRSKILIDSVYGSGEDYLDANDVLDIVNLPAFNDIWDFSVSPSDRIIGPPDGRCAAVGDVGLLGQFTGFIIVDNPGTWKGLTVVTESESRIGVHRLWSSANGSHFYTINDAEREAFLRDIPGGWIYEGIVYYAFADDSEPDVKPVYRFHGVSQDVYFYTISESEKNRLVQDFSHAWTYEGIAFYAFPSGQQPTNAVPVYRFWSDISGTHFYTIDEGERDTLISEYAHVWTYEGVAWYAYR